MVAEFKNGWNYKRNEDFAALKKSERIKFIYLSPVLFALHFSLIFVLAEYIGTQSGIIGIFFIAFFTWYMGLLPGIIYSIGSTFLTGKALLLQIDFDIPALNNIMGIAGYFLTAFLVSYISKMHYTLRGTKKQLELEHEKTELLMANILPSMIADRLKKGDTLIADRYSDSTILFCDIVGFTKFSHDHTPEEMVSILDELISSFDKLSESLGLEKIKTIGDAYLVVCGLPEKRKDHAVAIGKMSLAMRCVVEDLNKKNELNFDIRIGIHSGPVIGGVIGKKKFTFDIWGDTVNVASRLESHGIPGEIQVSKETYLLLKDDFIFEERGEVELKNRGAIRTWLLKSERV